MCIADEVQTGFGRTGSDYWGFQNHDVVSLSNYKTIHQNVTN